jgi:multiple sugar transport system substrate-binding protein
MRVRTILLAAALVLVPLGARAADLTVWWEQGYHPEEDEAVRETVAAFEQETGKQVELVFHPQAGLPARTVAAVEAGTPPDFVFGLLVDDYFGQWAHEGRLVDLTDVLEPLAAQFDKDALAYNTLLDATTGKRGLYALPMGSESNYVHLWRSLLERAGFTLDDIPKEWEPFWAFWCDKVQPAVRKVTGSDDVYGVGLSMAAEPGGDAAVELRQFVQAYEADYVTRDGRLVIDDPEVRARLVEALTAYTDIHRKGCTPPASIDWVGPGNNKAFLAQTVVMTPNPSLSIPNALRSIRPEEYHNNMVTIAWPSGANGQPLAIVTPFHEAMVFRNGGHDAAAKEFVRFLVVGGWLAHWLDFARDRLLPPMPALLEGPFSRDVSDPHQMRSVHQFMTQPRAYSYSAVSGEWRHLRVDTEGVWAKAVHRVAAEGISPEQAANEAIARIKQLLSE